MYTQGLVNMSQVQPLFYIQLFTHKKFRQVIMYTLQQQTIGKSKRTCQAELD